METWVGRFLDGRKATERFGMRLMPCRVTASRKCQCDCQQGATVAFTCVSKQLQHSQFFVFCSLLGLSFSPGLYGFIQSDSLGTCYLTLRALSALSGIALPLPLSHILVSFSSRQFVYLFGASLLLFLLKFMISDTKFMLFCIMGVCFCVCVSV